MQATLEAMIDAEDVEDLSSILKQIFYTFFSTPSHLTSSTLLHHRSCLATAPHIIILLLTAQRASTLEAMIDAEDVEALINS